MTVSTKTLFENFRRYQTTSRAPARLDRHEIGLIVEHNKILHSFGVLNESEVPDTEMAELLGMMEIGDDRVRYIYRVGHEALYTSSGTGGGSPKGAFVRFGGISEVIWRPDLEERGRYLVAADSWLDEVGLTDPEMARKLRFDGWVIKDPVRGKEVVTHVARDFKAEKTARVLNAADVNQMLKKKGLLRWDWLEEARDAGYAGMPGLWEPDEKLRHVPGASSWSLSHAGQAVLTQDELERRAKAGAPGEDLTDKSTSKYKKTVPAPLDDSPQARRASSWIRQNKLVDMDAGGKAGLVEVFEGTDLIRYEDHVYFSAESPRRIYVYKPETGSVINLGITVDQDAFSKKEATKFVSNFNLNIPDNISWHSTEPGYIIPPNTGKKDLISGALRPSRWQRVTAFFRLFKLSGGYVDPKYKISYEVIGDEVIETVTDIKTKEKYYVPQAATMGETPLEYDQKGRPFPWTKPSKKERALRRQIRGATKGLIKDIDIDPETGMPKEFDIKAETGLPTEDNLDDRRSKKLMKSLAKAESARDAAQAVVDAYPDKITISDKSEQRALKSAAKASNQAKAAEELIDVIKMRLRLKPKTSVRFAGSVLGFLVKKWPLIGWAITGIAAGSMVAQCQAYGASAAETGLIVCGDEIDFTGMFGTVALQVLRERLMLACARNQKGIATPEDKEVLARVGESQNLQEYDWGGADLDLPDPTPAGDEKVSGCAMIAKELEETFKSGDWIEQESLRDQVRDACFASMKKTATDAQKTLLKTWKSLWGDNGPCEMLAQWDTKEYKRLRNILNRSKLKAKGKELVDWTSRQKEVDYQEWRSKQWTSDIKSKEETEAGLDAMLPDLIKKAEQYRERIGPEEFESWLKAGILQNPNDIFFKELRKKYPPPAVRENINRSKNLKLIIN